MHFGRADFICNSIRKWWSYSTINIMEKLMEYNHDMIQ